MNRIFHARVPWHTIVFLILLTFTTVWALWIKLVIPGTVCLLLLIMLVERIIHTTYTVTTDGMLVVSHGRFSKPILIPLAEIKRIEKLRSTNFGRFHLSEHIVVYYGKETEKSLSLQPIKEEEFVETIRKKRM